MKRIHLLLVMLGVITCNNAYSSTENRCIEQYERLDRHCFRLINQLRDSIPLSQKPYYEKVVEYLLNDKEVRLRFSFLSTKKIRKRLKPEIKVDSKLFALSAIEKGLTCFQDSVGYIDHYINTNNAGFKLSDFSTSTNKYNYVVFFSPLENGIILCKVVSASHSKIDEDFYVKTRFGKVLTIQFCFRGFEIAGVKMVLSSSN